MNSILNWLDDRTGYKALLHETLYERVPGGARWRYVWGSTLVFAFFVQAVTGFFLWAAYSPNAQGAWESVHHIQYDLQGGWLLRGLHHFMAQAMVVLLALHLMQVVIDGAYRAPREINFWIGLILMQIVLGLSLTGYLLPWDQKGYWATKVATNIMGITPGIGPQLQRLVIGGADYGHHTLTRFFAIHAGLLPALLIGFVALHIYVFRRHGITAHKPDSGEDTTFWPDQVLRDAVACLAVLAVVIFLVYLPTFQGHAPGAHLSAPADPAEQYSAARPEWYFLFLFQLLKYFPGETEVIGSHVLPGGVILFMFLMPFVGRWKLGHVFNVLFLLIVMLGAIGLTAAAVIEDRGKPEFIAAQEEAERVAERTHQLVEEYGITTAGAVDLVRNDPMLHGPKVFAKHCAVCHSYDGTDGTGKELAEKPTAPDLGNFGSREWMRSLLVNFQEHFKNVEEGFAEGEMGEWSTDNREVMEDESNAESVKALVEFIVAQAERKDLPETDPELVTLGRDIFEFAELANGEFSLSCVDCHNMHAVGEEEPISEDLHAPLLTGYGSAKWIRQMIIDPDTHYGETNLMPALGEKMTEQEMDLLVKWMMGDYLQPDKKDESDNAE